MPASRRRAGDRPYALAAAAASLRLAEKLVYRQHERHDDGGGDKENNECGCADHGHDVD